MNGFSFNKYLAAMVVGMSSLVVQSSADEPKNPQNPQNVQSDECSKEILLSYFPKQFVQDVLKSNNVPQDQWAGILQDLDAKDRQVISTIEQKAGHMNPNPLKDPQQRAAVAKLFRETLTQMFTEVLNKHGVKDEKQIQGMLDEVQKRKAKRFAECMEKQRATHQQQPPQQQQQQQAPQQQQPVQK